MLILGTLTYASCLLGTCASNCSRSAHTAGLSARSTLLSSTACTAGGTPSTFTACSWPNLQ